MATDFETACAVVSTAEEEDPVDADADDDDAEDGDDSVADGKETISGTDGDKTDGNGGGSGGEGGGGGNDCDDSISVTDGEVNEELELEANAILVKDSSSIVKSDSSNEFNCCVDEEVEEVHKDRSIEGE